MDQRLIGWFRRREGKPQPHRRHQQPQPKAPQQADSTAKVRKQRPSQVGVTPAAPELVQPARAPEEASPAAAARTNEGRKIPPRARPSAADAAWNQAAVPSAAEVAETLAAAPSAAEAAGTPAVVPSVAEAAETQAVAQSAAEAAKATMPALQARALKEPLLCTGSPRSLPARERGFGPIGELPPPR